MQFRDNCNFSFIDDAFDCDIDANHDQSFFECISPQDELMLNQSQYAFVSPPSSPLPDATISMGFLIRPNGPKGSKKEIYGKGYEHNKLLNLSHYNEPFEDRHLYKALGSPNKDDLLLLGKMYNERFCLEIKLKKYPKFKRDHSRRKDLAYWFLDDNSEIVIPWLIEIRKISF